MVIVLQSGMKCWQLSPSYKTSVVECDGVNFFLFGIMSQDCRYCCCYIVILCGYCVTARYEVSAASSLNMSAVESLPQHLQEAVAGDNQSFAQELRDWDAEQSRKSHSDSDITLQNTPGGSE